VICRRKRVTASSSRPTCKARLSPFRRWVALAVTAFTPIINAPEVAILGLSKSAIKPVWDGKQFVPRLILPTSLSYDHRVVDGAMGARFSAYLAEVLGDLRNDPAVIAGAASPMLPSGGDR